MLGFARSRLPSTGRNSDTCCAAQIVALDDAQWCVVPPYPRYSRTFASSARGLYGLVT
jgi:hypothetical protein